MQICKIPYAKANATENMAVDAAMLDLANNLEQIMWRLYGWIEPAITFGYSQKWKEIQAYASGFEGTCIRRMTGGGIVDHRHDLTYALALPSCHELFRTPATKLYSELHRHIAEILLDFGFPADLQECVKICEEKASSFPAGICFQSPEPFDVILKPSGLKLAGAAMKRNQAGILIQGSLSSQHLPGMSRDIFEHEFGDALARWLKSIPIEFSGTLPLEILLREKKRYESAGWNKKR